MIERKGDTWNLLRAYQGIFKSANMLNKGDDIHFSSGRGKPHEVGRWVDALWEGFMQRGICDFGDPPKVGKHF